MVSQENLTEMTLENLKVGKQEPSSYFMVCQADRRTNEMMLTQEHAWGGSGNSKEGSYGWSGTIREESHRRGKRENQGGVIREESHRRGQRENQGGMIREES